METTANSATFASPLTRPGRLSDLAGCATTAVFVLSGIDLRAVALGGLWLRDIALQHSSDNP
jgi:hypothetical protein